MTTMTMTSVIITIKTDANTVTNNYNNVVKMIIVVSIAVIIVIGCCYWLLLFVAIWVQPCY